MKKAFILIIAAVATIACTKESNTQDKYITQEGGLLSIEATIAPFVDDATKASISVNASGALIGTFSWSEGDQIAFPVTGDPAYVALTYNPENGKFEGKANDGQAIDNKRQIVYPASRVIGGPYSTTFASIAEAKAGFKMTASVPASLSEKIIMTHESALVHVQFTNVPNFADKLVVSDGSDIATISTGSASGDIHFYVPITPDPDGAKTYTFTLKDAADNVIKAVASDAKTLVAGKYYNTPNVAIPPFVDVAKNATSWGDVYVYLYSGKGDYEVSWGSLSSVMKSYTKSGVNHYYRILPEDSLGNTYSMIVFNSDNDHYRITTTLTVEAQNYLLASQKDGIRRVGDTHHRLFIWDQALAVNTNDNPDTYLFIKSITGVEGTAFTGSWESASTKAIGWFNTKRNSGESGRYYYFDTDAIKNYSGKAFVFEYTMYEEGCTGQDNNRWRALYNQNSPVAYSDNVHLIVYDDGGFKFTNDTDFDTQVSE